MNIVYKPMYLSITREEIQHLLNIIYPDICVELERYVRCDGEFIEVYFKVKKNNKIKKMDFLPDEIYVYEEDEQFKGQPFKDRDIVFKYQQFMLAKGYSEFWKTNPYLVI